MIERYDHLVAARFDLLQKLAGLDPCGQVLGAEDPDACIIEE